jgi:hypothetical protein
MNLQNLVDVGTKPELIFVRKNYELQREAREDWDGLCFGSENTETGLRRHMETYPDIRPEAFKDSGRHKKRRGHEFLRGKSRKGTYVGGPLGRVRVIAGKPLELRRIPFSAVLGLEGLESDLSLQFTPELVKFAVGTLKPHIGGPAFGCVENGRLSKTNHFHVFVAPGSCELGVSNGVISDERLPQAAAYLGKGPCWNFETALAYLKAKRARPGCDVPSRYFQYNLGNKRSRPITLEMIEEALGYSLAKPEAVETPAARLGVPSLGKQPQALASLLTRAGATPEESQQVVWLYRAYSEGICDGVALKLKGRFSPDLAKTLKAYFDNRTWLSSGEVGDLAEFATALNLSLNVPKLVRSQRKQTRHVRPYRPVSYKGQYQTGHVRLT